jgi:flagellar hook-length control protein FliK
MAVSTNPERCPVPRVASDSNVLLHSLHNAGVRHRTAASDDGDQTSPFAALVDSADTPAARAPTSRGSANRAASTSDRNQRPSEAPPAKNDSTPDRANAADAADAAQDPSKPSESKKEATDATETKAADGPDEESTQEATASATDLLDLLTPTVIDSGSTAPSVPTPPAAAVSIEAALTAQGAADGESSDAAATPVAAPDAPTVPAAQSATPDVAPTLEQPTADAQTATPEQTAPAAVATDNSETVSTADGKAAAAASDQKATATQASQDPAPAANEKQPPEQSASQPLTASEQQPTNAQVDAAIAQVGKRATSKPHSTPADARKSDAATNVEDNGSSKTAAAPTDSKDPAAPTDRPTPAPRRTHAEASSVEDKQTASLAAGAHDASQKAPADSFHALLLANDQAAATTAANQPAPAATSDATEPAVPIAGLAVEIAARAQAGQNRFEIRLDPPELGRIDVRLDIDSSGQVTSRLVVERADTLEHLRRDSAGLERALQDAGLKTGENGLQFSLRDQGFAGRDDNSQSPATAQLVVPDPDLAPVEIAANAYGRMMRTGGVDIRV